MVISTPMVEALELMETASLAESSVTSRSDGTVYHQTAKNLVRAGLARPVGTDDRRRPLFVITDDGRAVLRVVRRMRNIPGEGG